MMKVRKLRVTLENDLGEKVRFSKYVSWEDYETVRDVKRMVEWVILYFLGVTEEELHQRTVSEIFDSLMLEARKKNISFTPENTDFEPIDIPEEVIERYKDVLGGVAHDQMPHVQ